MPFVFLLFSSPFVSLSPFRRPISYQTYITLQIHPIEIQSEYKFNGIGHLAAKSSCSFSRIRLLSPFLFPDRRKSKVTYITILARESMHSVFQRPRYVQTLVSLMRLAKFPLPSSSLFNIFVRSDTVQWIRHYARTLLGIRAAVSIIFGFFVASRFKLQRDRNTSEVVAIALGAHSDSLPMDLPLSFFGGGATERGPSANTCCYTFVRVLHLSRRESSNGGKEGFSETSLSCVALRVCVRRTSVRVRDRALY